MPVLAPVIPPWCSLHGAYWNTAVCTGLNSSRPISVPPAHSTLGLPADTPAQAPAASTITPLHRVPKETPSITVLISATSKLCPLHKALKTPLACTHFGTSQHARVPFPQNYTGSPSLHPVQLQLSDRAPSVQSPGNTLPLWPFHQGSSSSGCLQNPNP